MKKFILGLFLGCLAPWYGSAQTLRTFFAEMPDSIVPLLTRNNRLDCIDFLDSRMQAVVENRLEGRSELKQLTDDFLELGLTAQSRVEMKLLPADTASVVCLVATYRSPAAESEIRFYDLQGRELPAANYLTLPPAEAYWQRPDTLSADEYAADKSRIETLFVEARLSAAEPTLTFSLSTAHLTDEGKARVVPLLRPGVTLVWRNGRFERDAK